jgi:hypothetical protein
MANRAMGKPTAPWGGHRKTTATADPVFADSDRALYTVCEFWAAAMHCTLRGNLGSLALLRLHAAEVSFALLGIPCVARVLRTARQQLTDRATPLALKRVAKSVEDQLACIDENVDQLIARFAKMHNPVGTVTYSTMSNRTTPGGRAGLPPTGTTGIKGYHVRLRLCSPTYFGQLR